jgi:prophage antirepressor-like protein
MTAQNIIPFAFEEHLIRVVKPNGEPWFVGKDVCQVLEIRDHHQALDRLDADEKGGYSVPTPQGEQTVTCVSEPGVFRLIFTSRKAQAERFKRWLAHDVLPSLRKSGHYALPGQQTEPLFEFPTEDVALSEHMAKLATLRECRMIHGARAAARLWRRLGMPAVEESRIYEADSGRACLAKLLDAVAIEDPDFGKPIRLRAMIESAFNEHLDADQALRDQWGIRVDRERDGVVIANSDMKLSEIYRGTPWADGGWRYALRRLPGAQPASRMTFAGQQRRGTFLPGVLLDEPPAPPTGGNVVPIKP